MESYNKRIIRQFCRCSQKIIISLYKILMIVIDVLIVGLRTLLDNFAVGRTPLHVHPPISNLCDTYILVVGSFFSRFLSFRFWSSKLFFLVVSSRFCFVFSFSYSFFYITTYLPALSLLSDSRSSTILVFPTASPCRSRFLTAKPELQHYAQFKVSK